MPNALPTAHSTQVSSVIYHVFSRVEISPTFATTTSIFIPSLSFFSLLVWVILRDDRRRGKCEISHGLQQYCTSSQSVVLKTALPFFSVCTEVVIPFAKSFSSPHYAMCFSFPPSPLPLQKGGRNAINLASNYEKCSCKAPLCWMQFFSLLAVKGWNRVRNHKEFMLVNHET